MVTISRLQRTLQWFSLVVALAMHQRDTSQKSMDMRCEGILAKRLELVGTVSNTPSFDTQAKSNDTTSTRVISFVTL